MSNTNMETPPSSPPHKENPMDPPDLTATMSLSPIEPITSHPQDTQTTKTSRGHVRTATPSTPIPEEYASAFPLAATARSSGATYSTPGRSGASCFGGPHPLIQGGHSHLLLSDLTPVISNSNATYVDTLPSHQGARPGMPGFRVPSMDGSAGIIMRKSSIPDTDNDKSVARGLRQRRSCMPLPRAGLPPAKRSSIESNSINPTSIAAGTTTAPSQGLRRMPSNASEDSSLRGTEHLRLSPSNNTERNGDGVGLMMGERLAMPSYGSMCSDDESSLDTSNHAMFNERETMGTTNVSSMFRETAGSNNLAAPIELQPNRKYFSFQGVNQ